MQRHLNINIYKFNNNEQTVSEKTVIEKRVEDL